MPRTRKANGGIGSESKRPLTVSRRRGPVIANATMSEWTVSRPRVNTRPSRKKKSKEGMQRYHTMPAEKREEVKRKNLIFQKAWRNKMIQEGTYEEYQRRLNARRREQLAAKKRAMGAKGWKEHQKAFYARRSELELSKGGPGWTSIWPVPFLYCGCRWTGLSPSRRRRTLCKRCVPMHCSKWTPVFVKKNPLNMCVQNNVSFYWCVKHGGLLIQSYMPNFSLAFMIFLTVRSVGVLRPGS